jgi:hypothetical protein
VPIATPRVEPAAATRCDGRAIGGGPPQIDDVRVGEREGDDGMLVHGCPSGPGCDVPSNLEHRAHGPATARQQGAIATQVDA